MSSEYADNLERVTVRMAAACARAGRDPDAVRLVAVSKTFPPDAVREMAEAGQILFGENRVQEARLKVPACPGHLEWHMIGHLQRNKVRLVVPLFQAIHSVDSLRLLESIDEACGQLGRSMPVCLQVNVSGERSKFGMAPTEAGAVLEAATTMMNVDVVGLMTIPPFDPEPEAARPFFRDLRLLRDALREEHGFDLPELSMGMSQDFEVAIEEGATWVRVGSLLFGKRRSTMR